MRRAFTRFHFRPHRPDDVGFGPRRTRYELKVRTQERVIDGVKVHWAELGDPQAKPTVLIHGISDSHRSWLRMAPHLASGRRLLMVDLAGHGLSGRPDASYTLDWHAKMVGRWLEALHLEKVDLVGHSYGGGVAQWMLLDFSERIRRVGLVAAGGLGREVGLPLRLSTLPLVVERLGQPLMAPGTALALRLIRGAQDVADIVHRAKMSAIPGSARALARTMRDVVSLTGQIRNFFDKAYEIPDLPPIGLFWGDADPVIPHRHAVTTARLLGGAPLWTFEGCGHFPQVERPVDLAKALSDFLDGPESRRPSLPPKAP